MTLLSSKHIAILQTAFLGDVALALYLAQEIRALHPTVRLSFVCTPQSADLVRCAEAVDEVIVFDKRRGDKGIQGLVRRARQLRRSEIDCVFALQRSARSAVLTRMSRAKNSVGFRQASLSGLYSARVPWELSQHEVERNHRLLSCFDDAQNSSIPSEVALRLHTIDRVATELEMNLDNVAQAVIIAPGSVWPTKRWDAERFLALSSELRAQGRPVYILGSKGDRDLCQDIADASGAVSLAGKTTMVQTLSILKAASVLVCNDSAPTHLASLTQTRSVVLYGSTLPEFGFAPRGEHDQVVEIKNLACRPCGLHGRAQCPRQNMECMNGISTRMVLDAMHRAES